MTILRLAAAQLHYHPAFEGSGKQALREPTGAWEGAGLSGLRTGNEEGDRLLGQLRERIERVYVDTYRPRLEAVVRFTAGLDADLLVLPEYAVPPALLPVVADAAGPKLTVVAGSHTITREGVKNAEGRGLGQWITLADIGRAIAPVVRAGKVIASHAKLSRSRHEPDLKVGEVWSLVALGVVTMGLLTGMDFLKRADDDLAPLLAKGLEGCAVLGVPSLVPFAALADLERNPEDGLADCDRPVVYASRAAEGGTRVFTPEADAPVVLGAGRAPVLSAGVEGVVVSEVQIAAGNQRARLLAPSRPLAAAVLMDARVWRNLKRDADAVLAARDVGEALDRIEAAKTEFARAALSWDLPDVARERWQYLGEGAVGTTALEPLHALVRDVWVEGLSRATEVDRGLVEGAVRVLKEVETKAPLAQKLVTIRGWLDGEVLGRFKGVAAAPEVVEAVTNGLLPAPHRLTAAEQTSDPPRFVEPEPVQLADSHETYLQRWAAWARAADALRPEEKIAFVEALARCIWDVKGGMALESVHWRTIRDVLIRELPGSRFETANISMAAWDELREGSFVVWRDSEGGGYYRFARRSSLEYLVARRAVRRLGERDDGALSLPCVSARTVAYARSRPGWEVARRHAEAILVGPYQRWISENALLLIAGEENIASSADRPWQLDGADLRGMDLSGAHLSGARLTGAVLDGADLRRVDFQGAAMRGASARGASLDGTRFDGADLREVGFEGSSAFHEPPVLRGARTEGTRIDGAAWLEPERGIELCGLVGWDEARWRSRASVEHVDEGRGISCVEATWHRGPVHGVAFSPDGSRLATVCGDGAIRVWETRTARLLQILQSRGQPVIAVAWTPDGERLATGSYDHTARVWDAKSGRLLQTLRGHSDKLTSVAWASDGRRLATGSFDKTARLWDVRSGELLQTLDGGEELISAVSLTADGARLATASSSHKTARVWDVKSGQLLRTFHEHNRGVASVAWTAAGERLATGSWDGTARIWDAHTGRLLQTLNAHGHAVVAVAWAANGRYLATGSWDRTAKIWETTTGLFLEALQGHGGAVTSVAWTTDQRRLATGSYDCTVRLWDATTAELLQEMSAKFGYVQSVRWTEGGDLVITGADATGADERTQEWDAKTGQYLRRLESVSLAAVSVASQLGGLHALARSNARPAGAGCEKVARAILALEGYEGSIMSMAWAPDDGRLAIGTIDKAVHLWDATTGKMVRVLEGHTDGIRSIDWSRDGRRLATGSLDETVRVWDVNSGQSSLVLEGHGGGVTSVAWEDNDRRLAVGAQDGMVHLWDIASARTLAILSHTPAGGMAASGAFASPSGDIDLSAFVVRNGVECAPLELYADLCVRPDIVTKALSGEPVPALYLSMDVARRAVDEAVDACLRPTELSEIAPIKSGALSVVSMPWKLPPELLAAPGFRATFKAIHPDGSVHAVDAGPDVLTLPALAPGAYQILLTLQLGDRYERSFNAPLAVVTISPYIAGPPVHGAELLGRDADLERIRDRLRHGSILLDGERRIGKTSLLHHFLDHPGGFLPVWLDGQTLSGSGTFQAWVTAQIRNHIKDAPAAPEEIPSFMRGLVAAGQRPLLLFDEIVHLRGLSAEETSWLRSLTLGDKTAVAIFAGSRFDTARFLKSLPSTAGSPFNHLQQVTIRPLNEPEMERIIIRPGVAKPSNDAVRRVIDLSGGRPYLAQRLCEAALERVSRQSRMIIERADVDAVTRDALVSDIADQHVKRWGELEDVPGAQRALTAYARRGASAPKRLHNALREHSLFDDSTWTVDPAFLMWIRERGAK